MSSNEACDDASKEALREQIALRNSYRRVLRVIYETIQEAKVEHLEPELCEEANITRRMLSLDDKSDHRPVFFDRYKGTFDDPKDPKDPPPWKYVPDEDRSRESLCLSWFFQHHTNHHWPEQAPGSWESGYRQITPGGVFEAGCYRRGLKIFRHDFSWKVPEITVPLTNPESWPRSAAGPNPPLPHARALLESATVGDERLLRGEILSIIQIMRAQLRYKPLRSHLLTPVLLFSAMAPYYMRVLEAYFDGSKLVIRTTKLYDFSEQARAHAIMADFSRWWYGGGIGDTKVLPATASAEGINASATNAN